MNYTVLKRILRNSYNKHKELLQLKLLRHIDNEIIIEYNIDNDIMTDYYNEPYDRSDYYTDRD